MSEPLLTPRLVGRALLRGIVMGWPAAMVGGASAGLRGALAGWAGLGIGLALSVPIEHAIRPSSRLRIALIAAGSGSCVIVGALLALLQTTAVPRGIGIADTRLLTDPRLPDEALGLALSCLFPGFAMAVAVAGRLVDPPTPGHWSFDGLRGHGLYLRAALPIPALGMLIVLIRSERWAGAGLADLAIAVLSLALLGLSGIFVSLLAFTIANVGLETADMIEHRLRALAGHVEPEPLAVEPEGPKPGP